MKSRNAIQAEKDKSQEQTPKIYSQVGSYSASTLSRNYNSIHTLTIQSAKVRKIRPPSSTTLSTLLNTSQSPQATCNSGQLAINVRVPMIPSDSS